MAEPLQRWMQQVHSLLDAGGAGVSDADLLARFVRQRDESALELILRRHERMVAGVCRRILGQTADAEDAFQATFLILLRKAHSVGRTGTLGGWLHRVAQRTAVRAATRRRQRSQREQLGVAVEQVPDAHDPTAHIHWHDVAPIVDEEINRLPSRLRLPVILCYLRGQSYEEAARELGCPKGTLATRLARARDLLQQSLHSRGVSLSSAGLVALLTPMPSPTLPTGWLFSAAPSPRSSGVALLSQEVIRSMMLMKLKMVAAVVLAIGVVGSGAGLVVHQSLQATSPPRLKADALAEQVMTEPPPSRADKRVAKEKIEAEWLEREEKWSKQRIEALQRLERVEEVLQRLDENARREMVNLETTIKRKYQALQELIPATGMREAALEDVKVLNERDPTAKKAIEIIGTLKDLENEAALMPTKHQAERREFRDKLVEAQEALALLQRVQEMERKAFQRRINDDSATSPEDRLGEMDRKLDMLLQEVRELKRRR